MKKRYILRLDDIAENMDEEKYFLIINECIRLNIKPILGVIPKNKDKNLLKYAKVSFDFWDKIKSLQQINKFCIALHGYEHLYISNSSGCIGIKNQSEFAGLPLDTQIKKIQAGINIFKSYDIFTDIFMAPSHSYDNNTLKALKHCNISKITDGLHIIPYTKQSILHIPQLFAYPRNIPFGLYTFCLHTNTMTENDINRIIKFLQSNSTDFIHINEVKQNRIMPNILNMCIELILFSILKKYRSGIEYKSIKK